MKEVLEQKIKSAKDFYDDMAHEALEKALIRSNRDELYYLLKQKEGVVFFTIEISSDLGKDCYDPRRKSFILTVLEKIEELNSEVQELGLYVQKHKNISFKEIVFSMTAKGVE